MRFVVLAFLSSISTALYTQPFAAHNYSVEEGLPSVETYDVFQDSKGFLWFGTDNGVCRFDGKTFESYHVKDGLTDPVVFGFTEDYKGRIWFRTYSGKISYFENEKIHAYKFNQLLSKICEYNIMHSLYCDSLDQMWFGIGAVIGKIDANGHLDSIRLLPRQVGTALYGDHASLAFYGPIKSINQLRINNNVFPISLSDTVHSYHVIRAEKWNNSIYISVNNNIFEYKDNNLRRVLVARAPIISLRKDRENRMWVGYMGAGVDQFKDNFESAQLTLYKDKSVTNIKQDHEGGLWLSTLEHGIYYIPNISIHNVMPENESSIKTLVNTGEYIITGDISGAVNAVDTRTLKTVWTKKFSDPVLSIFMTSEKELLISTTTHTHFFDRFLRARKTERGTTLAFSEGDDDVIWCVSGNSIRTMDKSGNRLETRASLIYRSIQLIDSVFFVTGRSGMHILDKNMHIVHDFKELDNFKISQLHIVNDSILLVTTVGNGFVLMNRKNFTSTYFHSEQNFKTDNIYAALVAANKIFLATDRGLASIAIDDLLNKRYDFNFLSRKSGLLSDKINFLGKGQSSVLCYTDKGVSVVPLDLTHFGNRKPIFVLAKSAVNNKPRVFENTITEFDHGENTILFEYRFIAFNNSSIITRYRISPTDNWLTANENKILFSSLAPGEYSFQLQYSTDNIHWSDALVPLCFTIAAPWYARWYVYPAGFLIFVVLGYLYFRYQRTIYREKNLYLKIINEHQQKLIQSEVVTLERERNRIAKDLHDGVGTTLSAIKLRVRQLLQLYQDPLADEIENQFQSTIMEIKNIIYGLTPPSLERYGLFIALKNYINRISKTLPIAISLKTYGYDVNKYELNLMIFRIIQELVSNSVKHSSAKSISIHVSCFDDLISIIYEDDGIGFQYDPLQNGLGLDSIESRIQSINGTFRFDSGDFGISYNIEIPMSIKKEAF